jgi:hypothetical protein
VTHYGDATDIWNKAYYRDMRTAVDGPWLSHRGLKITLFIFDGVTYKSIHPKSVRWRLIQAIKGLE